MNGHVEYGDESTRRLHQEGVSYGKGFDRQALMRLNRINDQWCITFRIEDNRALDVTIEDDHWQETT